MSEEIIFKVFSESVKTFIFEIEPKNWLHNILQRFRILPKQHVLNVKPLRYGVRSHCAKYINKAKFEKHYSKDTVFKAASLFAEHELDNVIMFLATVLWNKEEMPPKWLIKSIRQLDQASVDEIIDYAHESIDVKSFLHSIISMTGVSLQPEEIIAPEHERQENESLGLTS